MDISERIVSSRIERNEAGLRLDVWLGKRFTYYSRNQWQAIIKKGQILVNSIKARSSRVLADGDEVRFIFENEEPPVNSDYEVVFEDEHFILVNKPPNLPCHPAGGYYKHTLWYIMSLKYGKIFTANRLDRETSGLVAVCKNAEAAKKFSELFISKDRVVKKYIALVFGRFEDNPLRASGFLMPDRSSPVHKKRKFIQGAMPESLPDDESESAETLLRGQGYADGISVVEAQPITGRLHQIRATLCSLGFPMVGDKLYGPDSSIYLRMLDDCMTECDTRSLILPRQALHSFYLALTHPFTGRDMEWKISVSDDIRPLYERCMGV